MAKRREGMTKYITVGQGVAGAVKRRLEERLKLKVKNLGYTDSSTTTRTLMLRTKRSLDEVQEEAWHETGWVKADLEDPRERGFDGYVATTSFYD